MTSFEKRRYYIIVNKFCAKFTAIGSVALWLIPFLIFVSPVVNSLLRKTGESLAKCGRRSLHFGKISFLKSWKKEICRWICMNFCTLGQATCAENASICL